MENGRIVTKRRRVDVKRKMKSSLGKKKLQNETGNAATN